MSHTLARLPGGSGTWSQFAATVVLVVGALAIVGSALGEVGTFVSPTLTYLGGAALVVLIASIGRDVALEARLSADHGGGDRALDAEGRPVLALYQAEGCPHCSKVRRFCTRNGISLVLHNPRTVGPFFASGTVTNGRRHDELTDHGQDQIPLLVDTAREVALYESDDIVSYLEEHYA